MRGLKMDRCLKKVQLFCNDKAPKLNFICDLLDENSAAVLRRQLLDVSNENGTVEINISHTNGCGCSVHERNGSTYKIETPILPFGIGMDAFYNTELTEEDVKDGYDMLLFLIPYPYMEKDYLAQIAESVSTLIHKKNSVYNIKAVVYKNISQQQSFTDIDNSDPKSILENTQKQFKRVGKETVSEIELISEIMSFCYFDATSKIKDLINIFSMRSKNLLLASGMIRSVYNDWKEANEDFKYYHEIEMNKLSEFLPQNGSMAAFQNIISYRNNKGQNDVIKHFVELYREKELSKVIGVAAEIYCNHIEGICFWDLKNDAESFMRSLYSLFDDEMKKSQNTIISCPEKEYDYQQVVLNQEKCDTKFKNRISVFIQEEILNFIFKKIKDKEDILDNFFV